MKIPSARFIQVRPIKESSHVFQDFENNKTYFYYFQKDKLDYLFFYGLKDKSDYIYFPDLSVTVIKELDRRKRKIRSFRGFLLFVLEVIGNEKDVIVLKTNLQPFFWSIVKDIINQNRSKELLLNYLFPTSISISKNSISNEDLLDKYSLIEKRFHEIELQVRRFHDLLEEVFDTCEAYLQDDEFRDQNSEVDFNNSVEEISLKIQKYLNEE